MTLHSDQKFSDPDPAGNRPWTAIDPRGDRFGAGIENPGIVGSGRGHPLIAWSVILGILTLSLVLAWHTKKETPSRIAAEKGLVIQAQYLVGAYQIAPATTGLSEQLDAVNRGPIAHRICVIVVAAELLGPKHGIELLDQLVTKARGAGVAPTAEEAAQIEQLRRLFGNYVDERWSGPALEDSDRAALRQQLGWFGELALSPAKSPDTTSRLAVLGQARRTFVRALVATFSFLLLGVIGSTVVVILIGLAVGGVIQRRFQAQPGFGGVYAEAFAVWLVVELAVGLAASMLALRQSLAMILVLTLLAAAAPLVWPIIRGIPWRQLRHDLGLTGGQHPLVEILAGLVTYLAAIPALGVSLIVVVVWMKLAEAVGLLRTEEFALPELPSHPITEWLANGGWPAICLVLLLASVVAPLVEETLFRGLLYRHLRETTTRWRVSLSVLFSAAISSFVFAAMHPQGWLGIPPLMTLAVCFCLAREWRQSLLAPMTAHAVNNFVVTVVMLVLF